MHILDKITDQLSTVGLPLYAVTLTAISRPDTPLLLMLHWHGFRREIPSLPGSHSKFSPVPGSALQINEHWESLEIVETSMLDAAWQLGAWDIEREEKRACNTIGASEREAYECRQAFGEHPLDEARDLHLVEEAPDREEMLTLGARVGYIRWQFRPIKGGIWESVTEDDTLSPEGTRQPPCPISPLAPKGGKRARTVYRFGRINRIILP
jgi:hypothetical protein